jgi:hypothetical protein
MCGPASVEGPLKRVAGPKVLAEVLSIKTVTVGAIAAATVLVSYEWQ